MASQNRQIGKTILISGFGAFLTYAINFVLTPYITNAIGIEAYGFVSIAKTTVSYAEIAMTALTAFVVRYISVSYHEKRLKEATLYYSSSVFACLLFALIIFGVACIFIEKIENILIIPGNLVTSVKILFGIVFLNFVISTVNVPLGVYAYVANRLDIAGLIKIFGYILEVGVLYVIFKVLPVEVWYVGIGSICPTVVAMICNIFAMKRYSPELVYRRENVSLLKIKNLVKNGIWNSLNSLGNVLNSGLDLIISNLMLSGTATGQIAVSKTIGTMFQTVLVVVSQPFQPQMIKTYASGRMDEFLKSLKKAMIVCGWFSNVAFAGFVALGMLYFKLWLPDENTTVLYYLTVLTVVNYVTDGVLQPVYYINTLTLQNKIPCWITIAGGLCNVLGMYVLIKNTQLGIYSVAITTAVIMVSINLFFNPIYAAHCLNIKAKIIYKLLARDLLSCSIMVIIFVWIKNVLNPSNWVGLIVSAAIMCIIALPIHMLCMYDRNEMRILLNDSIKKIKQLFNYGC